MKRRFCYIIPTQDPKLHGGWVPAAVHEDEEGYAMMTGDPAKLQTPWVWGKTRDEAEKIAKEVNERMGLTKDDIAAIICSSLRLSKPRL